MMKKSIWIRRMFSVLVLLCVLSVSGCADKDQTEQQEAMVDESSQTEEDTSQEEPETEKEEDKEDKQDEEKENTVESKKNNENAETDSDEKEYDPFDHIVMCFFQIDSSATREFNGWYGYPIIDSTIDNVHITIEAVGGWFSDGRIVPGDTVLCRARGMDGTSWEKRFTVEETPYLKDPQDLSDEALEAIRKNVEEDGYNYEETAVIWDNQPRIIGLSIVGSLVDVVDNDGLESGDFGYEEPEPYKLYRYKTMYAEEGHVPVFLDDNGIPYIVAKDYWNGNIKYYHESEYREVPLEYRDNYDAYVESRSYGETTELLGR